MHKRILFKKYSIILPCKKDDLCASMRKVLNPYPLIRYNHFWHGNPYVLYGECSDNSFHIAANSNMFNAFIPVIHGNIEQTENDECRVEYRLIPNNITIVVSILFLIIQIAFYVREGFVLMSITRTILLSALFILIVFALSYVSSSAEMEKFLMYLKAPSLTTKSQDVSRLTIKSQDQKM